MARPLRSGSLFTGTGALDMAAAEVFGAEPAWIADLEPGAAALLAHHYPALPNLGDITRIDWDQVEPVELLTGGFPCQDISNAGRREGITGARSGLWSHYADAIRVLRPRYVLIENVAALVVRGLDRVLADLAALGFDAAWASVRASDVGAPHRRERVFILAVAEDADGATGGERRIAASGEAEGRRPRSDARRRGRAPASDTEEQRRGPGGLPFRAEPPVTDPRDSGEADADAARVGRQQGRPESAGHEGRPSAAVCGGTAAHSDSSGLEGPEPARRRDLSAGSSGLDWAGYAPAIHRWERITGVLAPAPTVPGARGGHVLNPALAEWMMGLPEGWITSVPGLSRSAQLKLAGNGVVPQQAVAAYRYLLDVLERDARSAA